MKFIQNNLAGPGICVAVTLATFVVVYYAIGGAVFPTDDAFINLHNAQVLRDGYDASYAGVPALVGATSGVHLALLLAIEQFIWPDTVALFMLSALIAVTYVLGMFGVCINAGCSRGEATLVALGSLVVAGALFMLLNGMDTGLAMAAVAWNIKLLTDKRRTLWLPVLCGLMPFIRPELSFLAAASMLLLLCDRDRSWGFKITAVALSALVCLPFLLWYWLDTGSVVPNTVGAKMYFFADRYLDWWTKSRLGGMAIWRVIAMSFPLVLCFYFMRPRAVSFLLTLFMIVFLASFLWRFPSGLTHNSGRYLYVFVPIVLFGVACGLASSFRKQALTLIIISILLVPAGFIMQSRIYASQIGGFSTSLADVVQWMNANLQGRPTVMVHDAGYVAYAGRFPLVDLVGLKTPDAAEVHAAMTYPSAGRLRSDAIARIAEKFKPQYLLAIQDWDDMAGLVDGLRDRGWIVREVYAGRAPAETPRKDIYHLFQLTSPEQRQSTPGQQQPTGGLPG